MRICRSGVRWRAPLRGGLFEDLTGCWLWTRLGPSRKAPARLVCPPVCGAVERIENCYIGIFLIYATARGQTFVDRELYLPRA